MFIINGKYTNADVMIDDVEQACVAQITNMVNHPAFTNPIRIMPDTHAGKGSVIGFTMPMTEMLIPNIIGVDIGCTDKDTEFLSPTGWKKIGDYNGEKVLVFNEKTNQSFWETPHRYVKIPFSGQFFHVKTKYGFNQMLSPEHTMILFRGPHHRTRRGESYIETAETVFTKHEKLKLGFRDKVLATIPNINVSSAINLTNEQIRVQVMAMADAHIYEHGNKCVVKFKKDRKIQRSLNLLRNAKIPFTMNGLCNTDKGTTISFVPPLKQKRISSFWNASLSQLKVIVDEVKYWDSDLATGNFCSTFKEDVDFVQYAYACCGIRSTINFDNREGKENYRTITSKNMYVGFAGTPKTNVRKIKSEDGYKYCFTTSTGFWIMRRGGCISVTGNCGMLAMNIGPEFNIRNDRFDRAVRKVIPFGFDTHDRGVIHMKNDFPWREVKTTAHNFSLAYNQKFGTNAYFDDYNMDWFEKKCQQIGCPLGRAINSIGTLGGGNHFVEVGKADNGDYWIVIHTGSRNFGKCVCEYWQNIGSKVVRDAKNEEFRNRVNEIRNTYKGMEIKKKIKESRKELGLDTFGNDNLSKELQWLEGEHVHGYLYDMIFAQKYAEVNRKYIASEILKVIGVEHVPTIETVHNFIDFRDFIIRKGAIRSYVGEQMIIPFNPRDGILICEGTSNEDWNCSAPHGAGRLMSRSAAKKKISNEDTEKAMEGVYASEKPKDESPLAYKDAKVIEEAIKPTANILFRIKPILNMKAGD